MPRVNWTPEIDAALGTMMDIDIIKHFGLRCGKAAIRGRRIKLGIEAFKPRVNWTLEIDAALGMMSDNDIVKHFGLTCRCHAAKERRRKLGVSAFKPKVNWTPEIDAALGTMTDIDVVKHFGLRCGLAAVCGRRKKLGIPPLAIEGQCSNCGEVFDRNSGVNPIAVHFYCGRKECEQAKRRHEGHCCNSRKLHAKLMNKLSQISAGVE